MRPARWGAARGAAGGPADHWHAAFGVFVCDECLMLDEAPVGMEADQIRISGSFSENEAGALAAAVAG